MGKEGNARRRRKIKTDGLKRFAQTTWSKGSACFFTCIG